MRKFYPFFILIVVLGQTHLSFAQTDSTLLAHINELIGKEPAIHLRADSTARTDAGLQIFFNLDSLFTPGTMSETESETLTELLLHLIGDTQSPDVLLLVKDKRSGDFKTLDYFVAIQATEKYEPVKNNDPYPDEPGKAGLIHARIFPGAGQPAAAGVLSGKTVWLSPGHGWQNTGSGFTTQRGNSNQLVEDFTTAETVDYYLQNYLINAGANVWSVRERDMNPIEIIVNNDNGAPGYTETGTWANGTIAGYGGTYRTSMADSQQTATAVFTPAVTVSGLYWVSVRYISGVNRATDVQYSVTHAGGTTTFTVNQEVHGDTWVYLGQFYFFAGGSYKITISNRSGEPGQAVVADAVRLGGGIGQTPDCVNGGVVSGKPRFEESARQYARYQGNPVCREDVTVRPTYAEYELSKGITGEINNAVFVSFHTNAGGGTGTETYMYNGLGSSQPNITPGSQQLRDSIHKQVIADLRAGWRSTWTDRGVKTSNLGELRELHAIPGTLLELAFHDKTTDAADLKEPEFRRMAARAIYKGILKFFHYRDGIPVVVLPEEPTRVAARNIGHAQIHISWTAPLTGGIYGDSAAAYRIYISENGRGFANAVNVDDTNYVFRGKPGTTYFFKITALNAGGESFASGVVAAHTPQGRRHDEHKSITWLLVDGFDRLDASAMLLVNQGAVLGNVRRMVLEKMNSYNYMVEHGNGLASCDWAFDGVQNEVMASGKMNLSKYFAVDWFVGEESTAGKTLDSVEKRSIKHYLDKGGRLLISGSEIGWDLGRAASPNVDTDFYNNYLKAVYVTDGAGTYNFTGTDHFFRNGSGTFGNGFNGYYNVDFPDGVNANGGSEVVLNYSGGTGDGAGVGFKGTFRVLYFGFPIEAIISDSVRNRLLCESADYLFTRDSSCHFVLRGEPGHHANHLKWEINNGPHHGYYQVERSHDGVHYEPVGTRIAITDVDENTVQFTDEQIIPSAVYRVVATDVNGKQTVSNPVIIQNNELPTLYVIGNPAHSVIRVKINGTGLLHVMLVNGMGQTLYQTNITSVNSRELNIPATRLAKGVYWLSAVNEAKELQTVKILIQ